MTTPQNSSRRRKQKHRRTKQLAEWRAKKEETGKSAPAKTKASSPKAKATPKG